MSPRRSTLLAGASLLLAISAAGCSDQASPDPLATVNSPQSIQGSFPGVVEPEFFEVCKVYTEGSGPDVTFNAQVDVNNDGSIDNSFSFTLSSGGCQDIWVRGGAIYDKVFVTEVVPSGYTTSHVLTSYVGGTVTSGAPTSSPSESGLVRGNTGQLVVYTNTLEPPPPPEGGEGCTPGYWKQEQHFDSWTSPYAPSTLFSDVFEDAFPGMTLLQVVSQGGGGLNALGRHTVAALLNSASAGVDYDVSTQGVIDAFNAVFPGGDYEGQKNIFAGFNELGCPLN